jgi:hypothetical protein
MNKVTKDNAQAIVFNNLYILSLESVNNTGTYNDLTYFADVTKFNQLPGVVQPQPYWGQFTGFDYDFFATQISSNEVKFYGAKGLTGNVQESLNDSIHNDNSSAIESKAILSWHGLGSSGVSKRINHIYFTGDTEDWNITLNFNAYRMGKTLPGEGEGIGRVYTTSGTTGGVVGTAIVGTDAVGLKGVSSTKYLVNLRGNFFTAEFSNCNADQFTRVMKLLVYFRNINRS